MSVSKPYVVSRKLVADLDTPVSAYLKLTAGEDYACLLESVEGGENRGRYSIIGLKPDLVWQWEGDTVAEHTISLPTGAVLSTKYSDASDPLASLRALNEASQIDLPEDLPPMAAGLVGYMGYEIVHLLEPIGKQHENGLDVPAAVFYRPSVMAIFDSVTQSIELVAPVRPSQSAEASSADAASLRAAAEGLLDAMIERLTAQLSSELAYRSASVSDISGTHIPSYDRTGVTHHTSDSNFADMVARAKEYILAGDIFQVVLSQSFSMPFQADPFALYRALRRTNPSPFMYHLHLKDFQIIGSSPEILVRLRGGEVTIRPIAGTRRRGETIAEDKALEQDLLADPKELSEHLMLLDLGRNDVGRAAKPGTVTVTDSFMIERYSHVMHIVSNVTGQIRDGADAIDALKAGFPAGTVSGAPKVRAMQIIAELEGRKRGPYAGTVGYFSADGSMDSCIVLRTAIVKDGVMHVQAGAGIVADSSPEAEQKECENKSMALIAAAKEALNRPNR